MPDAPENPFLKWTNGIPILPDKNSLLRFFLILILGTTLGDQLNSFEHSADEIAHVTQDQMASYVEQFSPYARERETMKKNLESFGNQLSEMNGKIDRAMARLEELNTQVAVLNDRARR